jgi:hypothetical protein
VIWPAWRPLAQRLESRFLQLQAASRGEGRPNACVEVGVRVAESGATFVRVQASRLMHGWRSVSSFSTPSVARDVHSSSPRSPAIHPVRPRSREENLESRPLRYNRDNARISYPVGTTTQRLIESNNIVAIPWQSKGRNFRGRPPLSYVFSTSQFLLAPLPARLLLYPES